MFIETDKDRAEKLKEYFRENNIPFTESNIHELIHLEVEKLTDEQVASVKAYYKRLEAPQTEQRHRKWDDKFHTAASELSGYFTGESQEEEIEYEKI